MEQRIKTVYVKARQTLWDIAIQEYGNAEGVGFLLVSNPGINITDVLTAGQEIIVYTDRAVRTVTEIVTVEPYASQLQQLLAQWSIHFQQIVDRYVSAVAAEMISTGDLPDVVNANGVMQITLTRTGSLHPLTINLGSIAAKKFWVGTMAEYEAIEEPDENTIYHIEEEEA